MDEEEEEEISHSGMSTYIFILGLYKFCCLGWCVCVCVCVCVSACMHACVCVGTCALK